MKNIQEFSADEIKDIEKAFLNSNVISGGANPRFLVNQDKGIQNEITNSLKMYRSFDIQVSYVVLSGLQRLVESLSNKPGSRFITTTDGFVTSPQALRVMLDIPGMTTRVYVPKNSNGGLHAKTYLFKNELDVRLIVGSANISNRAFGSVHESSLVADMKYDGELYNKYQDNYERVWQTSEELTVEFIESYEKKYYAYKNLVQNPILSKRANEIKPNLMQEEALAELKKVRKQDKSKALVVASTGSGKTYLAAFDVKNFNPKKLLFLVHNRTILRKAISSFKKVLDPKKRYLELRSSNIKTIDRYDYVFATPQTFGKYAKDFDEDYFDYIVIDEAHHTPASMYMKIISHLKPKFLLGMTATPDRPDGKTKAKDVYDKFDHTIPYEIRLHNAIEADLIAPFNYFGIGEDLADEKVKVEDKVKTIMKNIDKFGHFGKKLKALIFVSKKTEANELAEEFNNAGITAVSVNGETDKDLVDTLLTELGSDETSLQVIVSVNLLNEGIDVPEVNTIVMLRKTESSIIYIQQLGRGLRLAEPGKFVTVLDFVGNYAGSYKVLEGILDVPDATGKDLKEGLFGTPSMLSNIQLDEVARKRIYESIDNGMKGTRTILKKAFKEWVEKYGYIPTMKEYADKSGKMDEILLNFDSFQSLKAALNYIQPSDRYLDFFRFISQGILQAGTKDQILQTLNIIKNMKGDVDSSFLESYLLGEIKTVVSKRNKFFLKINGVVNRDVEDLLKKDGFKNDFSEFVEFIEANIKNQNRVLHKNYRRLDIPFMANRPSLMNLLEGQFVKEGIAWCMPTLQRQNSTNERKFANKLLDTKHILYITKDDSNSIKIENGDLPLEIFIKHADSKDSDLTYIGSGKVIENKGKYESKKYSTGLIIELDHEMPKWMVDDYTFKE